MRVLYTLYGNAVSSHVMSANSPNHAAHVWQIAHRHPGPASLLRPAGLDSVLLSLFHPVHKDAMVAIAGLLPRFLDRCRYSGLRPGSGDEPGNQASPNIMQLLTSKAVRAAVVIAVLLLVVFGLLQLPTSSFDRLRSSTAVPATFTPGDGRGPSSGTVDSVDWSRFAYVQYVTDTAYLCNSVMLFEILHRLGSKADRLMMYPSEFRVDDPSSTDGRLLRKARDEYGVKLVPIQVQRRASNDRKLR